MSQARRRTVVPLAYQRPEAAEACGVGPTFFDQHIRPRVPCVYVGGVRLWRASDLQRWLDGLPPAMMGRDQQSDPGGARTPRGQAQGGEAP